MNEEEDWAEFLEKTKKEREEKRKSLWLSSSKETFDANTEAIIKAITTCKKQSSELCKMTGNPAFCLP